MGGLVGRQVTHSDLPGTLPPPVGELEAARLEDLDESRRAWLVRAAVSKTRQARWVELPEDLFEGPLERCRCARIATPSGCSPA